MTTSRAIRYNGRDFSGTKTDNRRLPPELYGPCFWKGPDYGPRAQAFFRGPICEHYRVAVQNRKPSLYFNFVEKGRVWFQPRASRFTCPTWLASGAAGFGVGGFGRAVAGDDVLTNTWSTMAIGYAGYGASAYSTLVLRLSPFVTSGATVADAFCSAFAVL